MGQKPLKSSSKCWAGERWATLSSNKKVRGWSRKPKAPVGQLRGGGGFKWKKEVLNRSSAHPIKMKKALNT